MSVTANIETREHTNVISVPIQCVTTRLPKVITNAIAGGAGSNGPAASTNALVSNDPTNSATPLKHGEEPKPIEVVWVVDGDHVKMEPVKRGISDDDYVEITSGLKGGEDIVVGGFKAINRDLEDGKKVNVDAKQAQKDKEKTGSS
jgi:HlyD family secretion protein